MLTYYRWKVKPKESRPESEKNVSYDPRLEGLEPPTCGLEIRCSIRLSYRRLIFIIPFP